MFDGERIMYAKIMNNSGYSRLTNADGYVSIAYADNDRLLITHLGYDSLRFNPANYPEGDTALIYLTPKVFELQALTFALLGPRHTFDNRFVDTDLGLTDSEKVKEKLELEGLTGDLVALDQAAADGMRLGSPITALYERYSRRGRDRRRYAELVANDRRDSVNREKYNLDVVRELTFLPSLEETQEFMDFCSFDKDYIENTKPVDLYVEILRCKEEYYQLD